MIPACATRMCSPTTAASSLLFGGASDREVLGDTWGWDGRAWQRFNVPGRRRARSPRPLATAPAACSSSAAAACSSATTACRQPRRRHDGCWATPGRGTARAGPRPAAPPARAEAAAAWDPKRKRLVLFGGYTWKDGVRQYLQDTWEFNGAAWARFSTSGPSPRSGVAMAFDPELGQVVLFGGTAAKNDTWLWDGTAWSEVPAPTPPPGRYNAAIAAPSPAANILRFGGWDGQVPQRRHLAAGGGLGRFSR